MKPLLIPYHGFAATYIHSETGNEIIAAFSIRRSQSSARIAFDTINKIKVGANEAPLLFSRIIPILVTPHARES